MEIVETNVDWNQVRYGLLFSFTKYFIILLWFRFHGALYRFVECFHCMGIGHGFGYEQWAYVVVFLIDFSS